MRIDKGTMSSKRIRNRVFPFMAMGLGAFLLAGCDLGVLDPGTIEYDDLFEPQAIQPLVIGAERNLGRAISGGNSPHGGIFGAGAHLTDEIVHSGQWVGIRDWSNAVVVPDDVAETSTRWAHAQNARVTAEDAAAIISSVLQDQGQNPQASEPVATALIWAGFSSRVLADAFCTAVIDGGPEVPVSAMYEHAETHFTNVITIAGAAGAADLATAARAGRAQVRMMLGDWPGAVADAGQIPTGFVHEVRMSANATDEYNGLSVAFLEHAQSTVWGTPFAQYGTDLSGEQTTDGDPRVAYASRRDDGTVETGGDGRRENWRPHKYPSRADNHPIVKGTEMRLIEAEAALVTNSDIDGALAGINAVRAHHGLADVDATTVEEAWYVLQRERGIELWVEGRRLPDMRRWAVTPGYADFDVVRLEASGAEPIENDEVRNVLDNPMGELCLPMSRDERNSNPNL
jgi:starch-binding outer membrane protein, SusD/RagB family